MYNVSFDAARVQAWYMTNSGTHFNGIESQSGGSWSGWDVGQFETSATYLRVSFTYLAA